jgi:hypothetical protein
MARGTTSPDHRVRNAKLEHTVSYQATHSMGILELENRCTGNRTVGSNPTPLRQFYYATKQLIAWTRVHGGRRVELCDARTDRCPFLSSGVI